MQQFAGAAQVRLRLLALAHQRHERQQLAVTSGQPGVLAAIGQGLRVTETALDEAEFGHQFVEAAHVRHWVSRRVGP